MATAAGYALILPTPRRGTFREQIDEWDHFAEPVPDFEHSRRAPLVCFVSVSDGVITHIARGKRGNRAGTGLRRLNILDVRQLEPLVRIGDIVARVPGRLRASVRHRLTSGGVLSHTGFLAVVDAFREVSPTSRSLLDRFGGDRR